jgi:hypothetical protein
MIALPVWQAVKSAAMRAARALLNLITALLVTAAVAVALALYLAFAHHNVRLLRAFVGYVGRVVQGQRVERLDLDARLEPSLLRLSATATLEVRGLENGRRRLYALLNEGLRVERAWLDDAGKPVATTHYQLGPLLIISLPRVLAADETVRLGLAYSGNPVASGLTGNRGVLTTRDVILKPEHFWYPTDLQGFFDADVRVTLPAALRVVHNGREQERTLLGQSARVHWTSPRRVAGMALIAGAYREWSPPDDRRFRVALADDVDLDAAHIHTTVREAERIFTDLYGTTGFDGVTVVVSRAVTRAFNDGTGLIALAPKTFHDGDYGFGVLAHETAHNWWGGTVAEKWLAPGTGGEWIVEGFAELSSLQATEAHLGRSALLRRIDAMGFDPNRSGVLGRMSVLDNSLDPSVRATIYNKGPLAARLLQHAVGDEAFFTAMRQIIERFRYQQISDADVEATFAAVTREDLAGYFATWVRSDSLMDLALDPHESGGAVARNHGTAWLPTAQQLWRVPVGGEPQGDTLDLGATASLDGAQELILDPSAAMPDVYRSNNVFPPRRSPRSITLSARNELLVVYGEPHRWSPVTVSHLSAAGQTLHEWEFDRGLLSAPTWAADGIRALAVERDRNGVTQVVALNVADGSMKAVGHDAAAAAVANGLIVARGERLLRLQGDDAVTLAHHPGQRLASPLISPDEAQVAYTACGGDLIDIRVVGADGRDRLVFSWAQPPAIWRWSPNGTHLLAVLPGDWDWQLWEIPTREGTPRALVREATAIGDLAVAPDGARIAMTAVPTADDRDGRSHVFVIDRQSGAARQTTLDGQSVERVAWLGPDELVVVTAERDVRALPRRRQLQRLTLSNGSSRPFP